MLIYLCICCFIIRWLNSSITALPAGYKPPKVAIVESDPDAHESEADTHVVATIPPRIVGNPLDPDGNTEWIVLGKTKQRVLGANPAQYQFQPVPKPPGGIDNYVVKSTPTMGKGVFAIRDIKMGDIIFAERPLVIAPRVINPPLSEMIRRDEELSKYSVEDMFKVFLFEKELQMEVAVGRMDPQRREKFLALTNTHTEDGSGPLCGIMRTNLYECSELWDGDTKPDPTDFNPYGYSVLCDVGSRINHRLDSELFNDVRKSVLKFIRLFSCQPNAVYLFNIRSFSMIFMAGRDIELGEQIFYSYCPRSTSVAERKLALAPYGITNCACASCTNATPETDALRTNFFSRVREYYYHSEVWNFNGQLPEDFTLDEMLAFQKAVVKEGLHIEQAYWLYFMKALIVACRLAKMDRELAMNVEEMKKYFYYHNARMALMDSE